MSNRRDLEAEFDELSDRVTRLELEMSLLQGERRRISNHEYEGVRRRRIKTLPDIAAIDGQVTVDEAIADIQCNCANEDPLPWNI